MNDSMELILTIVDLSCIGRKIERSHRFNKEGGTIGSMDAGETRHWQVQDNRQEIQSTHARIIWRDGHFCLEDVSGTTFINEAEHSIGAQNVVALSAGDQIKMGSITFTTQIILGSEKVDVADYQHPQTLITMSSRSDVNQIIDEPSATGAFSGRPKSVGYSHRPYDPGTLGMGGALSSSEFIPSENNNLDTATDFSRAEPMLDEEFIDIPTLASPLYDENHESQPFESVAITPLMRGMGHFLNLADSQQANGFLEEAGRTLEAAIKGILLLEQDRIRVNKQLQPVEDNPLRLGLDYVATVDALFGDQKSQVHLSPSAAITECLSFLRMHAYASRQAVSEALTCVVDTFSPDILMARFQRYRRDHLVDINNPAWIWEMYNHYFEELKSTRQQGVDRLFHEVFEQVYDKALRDLRDEDKA